MIFDNGFIWVNCELDKHNNQLLSSGFNFNIPTLDTLMHLEAFGWPIRIYDNKFDFYHYETEWKKTKNDMDCMDCMGHFD